LDQKLAAGAAETEQLRITVKIYHSYNFNLTNQPKGSVTFFFSIFNFFGRNLYQKKDLEKLELRGLVLTTANPRAQSYLQI